MIFIQHFSINEKLKRMNIFIWLTILSGTLIVFLVSVNHTFVFFLLFSLLFMVVYDILQEFAYSDEFEADEDPRESPCSDDQDIKVCAVIYTFFDVL